jgi:hypothetical protein
MTIKFKRKSLELTVEQWQVLEEIAAQLKTCPPSGPTAGQPSWRSLFKEVADRELVIKKK